MGCVVGDGVGRVVGRNVGDWLGLWVGDATEGAAIGDPVEGLVCAVQAIPVQNVPLVSAT